VFRTVKLNQHELRSMKFPSTMDIFAVLTEFGERVGVGHDVLVWVLETT
jgi:hypothetical protein